jgi:NAD-dependent dihydropyrimidine dehydrogenase PreA subunit
VFFVGIRGTGAKILRPSEFLPHFDESTCGECGACEDRCPVDAITLDDVPTLDEDKCIGCGVCFPTCPTESIQFVRRPKPEQDRATAHLTKDLSKKWKETGRSR